MGETHVGPGVASANHHHGESETAIFVRSGTRSSSSTTVWTKCESAPRRATTSSCRRICPHREENPDLDGAGRRRDLA